MSIRVGFCLHAMNVAGAEVLVTQIIDRLNGRIEPTVFSLDSIGKLGEELQGKGIPVISFGRKPGFDRGVIAGFARELQSRRIDVIHAHQYTPFFYSGLARIRGSRSTKILLTEHGRHYPDVVSAKRRWINRLLLSRLADHSTACCAFSARALEQKDGFRNVEVLYNGIDASDHPARKSAKEREQIRARLGLSPDLRYIACIARFHAVKDHATLLRGFAGFHTKYSQTRLVLVGTGPEEQALRGLIDQLGIAHCVEFWGVRRDISDILQACDAFSLTSVSEASSLTLLEAMANGCPVAITDVGGNGEHITHGVNGLLSPRGDSEALAVNFERILLDYSEAESMARASRERVEVDFQFSRALARYMELYSSLSRS